MNLEQLKKIIIPTLPEILACLLLVSVTLLVIHLGDIVRLISQSSALTPDQLNNTYKHQLTQLDQYTALRNLVIMTFWASVGVGAYVIYLVLSQGYTSLRNEVVIDTQFTNQGRLTSRIAPIAFHGSLALGLFAALWISIKLTIPYWIELFEELLYSGNWFGGVVGPLAFALNLYILWILISLVRHYAR